MTEEGILKLLSAHDPSPETRGLRYRLSQCRRDERCILRAVFLMVILGLLSLAGLSYCAILAPQVLSDSSYHFLQGLAGLGLGALTSLVVFLGRLLWHRAAVSRLHRECRFWILGKSQLKEGAGAIVGGNFSGPSPGGLAGLPAP